MKSEETLIPHRTCTIPIWMTAPSSASSPSFPFLTTSPLRSSASVGCFFTAAWFHLLSSSTGTFSSLVAFSHASLLSPKSIPSLVHVSGSRQTRVSCCPLNPLPSSLFLSAAVPMMMMTCLPTGFIKDST